MILNSVKLVSWEHLNTFKLRFTLNEGMFWIYCFSLYENAQAYHDRVMDEADICSCQCWKWTLSLVGWENENWFLFPSICSACLLAICLLFYCSHIHPHAGHTFVLLHMHRNKCQSSSPSCSPQVMHAWHFVKTTAQESHHKLLLTDADSPMAHHSIHHTEAHCNFLYSVRLPSTPLWLQQRLQSAGCHLACCMQSC